MHTSPFEAFGVGYLEGSDDTELAQQLGAHLTDHRGLIELPAMAVLFDAVGGRPFYFADTSSSSLQSRLMMSAQHRPAVTDRLAGTSALRMSDDRFGTTVAQIATVAGELVCTGTARNVRVGRAVTGREAITATPPAGTAHVDVAPIPADLAGHRIVAQLARGERGVGPLARLLNGSVTVRDGQLRFTSETQPWMANFMGTMHGGVIGTIGAQGLSLGAQAHTAPGQDYQILDFDIGFYRSPAVDGTPVHVDVVGIKVGRRIGSFEATLTDGSATLLARATADVRFYDR